MEGIRLNKQDYYNSVTDQVKDLRNLASIQAELCFNLETLSNMLDEQTARNIKRVIITGCGDSYSAAGAMMSGFRKLSGLRKCNSPDIMDFCCFYSEEKVFRGYSPEQVLVAGISFSGGSARVVEALEKANALGSVSLLITRTPDSKGGRAAKHVFDVATPPGCNSPGLRSYYASLVGITALGAYLGLCNGTITQERFYQVKRSVTEYTLAFMERFEAIDDLMFQEALRMKDLRKFELIADWNEGYSAQFVEQKIIECGGMFCGHTTSEEFAHISFMARCPEEYGEIIIINGADLSMSRMKDTINGCLAQHRPTLIVTDVAPEDFDLSVNKFSGDSPYFSTIKGHDSMAEKGIPTFCQIPKAPEPWMSPLVDFLPGSLLAGYQAAVNEIMYFGGRYNFRTQTWNLD